MTRVFAEAFDDARKVNRFPRELCMIADDYQEDRTPERAAIEIKYDGLRCIAADDLMTRQGGPFDAASHLWKGIEELRRRIGPDYVIDGEFIAGTFEQTLSAFRRGSAPEGMLMVFDAVPLPAYKGYEVSSPLIDRRALLDDAFSVKKGLHDLGIGLVQQSRGHDADTIALSAGTAWDQGEEGIVVKDLDSPYVRKLTPYWQKVKRTETLNVVATGNVVVGPAGMIRSIVVRDNCGMAVTIGTGFKKSHTADDFQSGALLVMKHNGRTASGAYKSPRLLRFA